MPRRSSSDEALEGSPIKGEGFDEESENGKRAVSDGGE